MDIEILSDTMATVNKSGRPAILQTGASADHAIPHRSKRSGTITDVKYRNEDGVNVENETDVDENNGDENTKDYDENEDGIGNEEINKDESNVNNENAEDDEDVKDTDSDENDIKYSDEYYNRRNFYDSNNVNGYTGEGFKRELNGDHFQALQVPNPAKGKALTRIKRYIPGLQAYAYHHTVIEPNMALNHPVYDPHFSVKHDELSNHLGIRHLVRNYFNRPRSRALDIDFHYLDKVSQGNEPSKTLEQLELIKKKLQARARDFIDDFYSINGSKVDRNKTAEMKGLISKTNKLFDQVHFEAQHAALDRQAEELNSRHTAALSMEGAMNARLLNDLRMLKLRLNDLRAAASIRKQLRPHKRRLQSKIDSFVRQHVKKANKSKGKMYRSYLKEVEEERKSRLKFLKKQIKVLTNNLGKAKRSKDIEGRRLQILLIQHQLEDLLNEGEGVVDPPTGFLDMPYDVPYLPEKRGYTSNFPNPLFVPKNYYAEKFRYLRSRDYF